MAECPYCLETGNTFIVAKLDTDNQVEVEVVADEDPYMMVRYFNDGWAGDWSIGMRIKYCPMCGRRLSENG